MVKIINFLLYAQKASSGMGILRSKFLGGASGSRTSHPKKKKKKSGGGIYLESGFIYIYYIYSDSYYHIHLYLTLLHKRTCINKATYMVSTLITMI